MFCGCLLHSRRYVHLCWCGVFQGAYQQPRVHVETCKLDASVGKYPQAVGGVAFKPAAVPVAESGRAGSELATSHIVVVGQ